MQSQRRTRKIYYVAGKRKKNKTMTELLRQALRDCESLSEVERQTGVKRQTLAKFMRGEQSIRLDSADLLALHFGIRVELIRNAIKLRQVQVGSFIICALFLQLACHDASNPGIRPTSVPKGAIWKNVEFLSEPCGARIEVKSNYIGDTPVTGPVWYLPDDENLGINVNAYPKESHLEIGRKVFRPNSIPDRVFFDLRRAERSQKPGLFNYRRRSARPLAFPNQPTNIVPNYPTKTPNKVPPTASPFVSTFAPELIEPEVVIQNDAWRPITLILTGAENLKFQIRPGEKKKVAIKDGMYAFHASCPNATAVAGEEDFKKQHRYTWTFYLERE